MVSPTTQLIDNIRARQTNSVRDAAGGDFSFTELAAIARALSDVGNDPTVREYAKDHGVNLDIVAQIAEYQGPNRMGLKEAAEFLSTSDRARTLMDTIGNASPPDGQIGKQDLEIALTSPKCNAKQREAARAILAGYDQVARANPQGKYSDLIELSDLQAFVGGTPPPAVAMTAERAATILSDANTFRYLDIAGNQSGVDGQIGPADLRAGLSSPNVSAEAKQAIRFVLRNYDAYAQGGRYNDLIEMNDLGRVRRDGLNSMSDKEAAQILLTGNLFERLDVIGNASAPDGLAGDTDIRAMLNERNLTPKQKQALQIALANYNEWKGLGRGAGSHSNLIDKRDLEAVR